MFTHAATFSWSALSTANEMKIAFILSTPA